MHIKRIRDFADRPWYALLVGALAVADQFIVIVPIEMLMLPAILLRPQRWLRTAILVATGCALGALLLAALTDHHGMAAIQRWAPQVVASEHWARSMSFIDKNGAWALFLVSVGPLPQQPAVALAGLSHLSLFKVFFAIWMARSTKYCALAYLASHAPKVLAKIFPGTQKILKEIHDHERPR